MGLIQTADKLRLSRLQATGLDKRWLAYKPEVVVMGGAGLRNLAQSGSAISLGNDARIHGGSFVFPGADGYVNIGSGLLPITTNAHTMVCVCRLDRLQTAYALLASYSTNGVERVSCFFSSDASYADFSVGTANSALTTKASLGQSGPVLNTWRTIVMVRTANTSAGHALFVNGKKLVTSASGAHAAASGDSVIGQAGTASVTNDFNGLVKVFALFDSVMPDDVALKLSADPWSLVGNQRRIWVPVSAGGGASAALSGVSSTAAAGTLAPSISAALLGSAASAAAGSVAAGSDVTTALTGVSATSATGTLSASTSVALTGVSSTTAAGTLAASISAALTGVSSTAAAGTLSAGGDASAAVTGQAASTAQGTVGVTVSGAAALSGASAAASAGTVAVGISTALTGASAAASAGSLTAAGSDVSVTISGQAVSVAQGTVGASASGSVSVALSGAAAVIAAGDIFVIAPSVGWTPVDDSVSNLWVPVDDSNAASWA
jgi:hypothetical protein